MPNANSMPPAESGQKPQMFPNFDLSKVVASIDVDFTDDGEAVGALVNGYAGWAVLHPGADLQEFFGTPEGRALLQAAIAAVDYNKITQQAMAELAKQLKVKPENLGSAITDRIVEYYGDSLTASLEEALGEAMESYMTSIMTQASGVIAAQMSSVMESFASAMSIDADAFANAFEFNMS